MLIPQEKYPICSDISIEKASLFTFQKTHIESLLSLTRILWQKDTRMIYAFYTELTRGASPNFYPSADGCSEHPSLRLDGMQSPVNSGLSMSSHSGCRGICRPWYSVFLSCLFGEKPLLGNSINHPCPPKTVVKFFLESNKIQKRRSS